MKFEIKRNVAKGVFSTEIKFSGYGTGQLTPEQEKEIVEDFGVTLAYKDITFEGNYQLSGNDIIQGGAQAVTISLNNLEFDVDDTFEVSYSVTAASIQSSEMGNTLDKPELVAQAKCVLFEDKVQAQLKTLLDAARAKKTLFEKDKEVTI